MFGRLGSFKHFFSPYQISDFCISIFFFIFVGKHNIVL